MHQTLLLVSGQPNLISNLLDTGTQAGYKTYTTSHTNDALQIMFTRNIDAVICDATLSDIDGYHLCYKIRKNQKLQNTPVIICSTNGNTPEAQMARDMGADIFVTDGNAPGKIVDRVNHLFTNPGNYPQNFEPQRMSAEAMHRYNEELIARLETRNAELHKAKSTLETTVKILNEAQQIAHIGSFELNLESYEANWSDEAFRILGTTPQETTPSADSFIDFIHPEEREAIKTKIRSSFIDNRQTEFKCRIVRKDNTIRQLYCFAGFTFNEYGKAIRTYGIIHDITEKVMAENQVIELNADLEQRVTERTEALVDANMQLESFAYSVSHDLRAPLRSIYSFAQLLHKKHGYQLDESGLELLQFICASATKMQLLISDLLTFSRLDKNGIDIVDLDMNELVKSTWTSLTASLEKVPSINTEILPTIKGDRSMITQVLVNFLGNAIKYSSNNQSPVVEIGTVKGCAETTFYVKDNGVGFDMKHYDKLFAVFQRLHTSNEFEGSGVGLAIVKRIIDKHNGRVWAESEPGKGATFYFSLPS